MATLQNLTQAPTTLEAALAMIAAMQAEQNKPKAMSFKVTEKGGLSVYGLGRFPVTLYRGQWERLIAAVPQLEAFIKANEAVLSVKEAK